jgi:hypothetical protein
MRLTGNKNFNGRSPMLMRIKVDLINIYDYNWKIYEIQNIKTNGLLNSNHLIERINHDINRE